MRAAGMCICTLRVSDDTTGTCSAPRSASQPEVLRQGGDARVVTEGVYSTVVADGLGPDSHVPWQVCMGGVTGMLACMEQRLTLARLVVIERCSSRGSIHVAPCAGQALRCGAMVDIAPLYLPAGRRRAARVRFEELAACCVACFISLTLRCAALQSHGVGGNPAIKFDGVDFASTSMQNLRHRT